MHVPRGRWVSPVIGSLSIADRMAGRYCSNSIGMVFARGLRDHGFWHMERVGYCGNALSRFSCFWLLLFLRFVFLRFVLEAGLWP